MPFVFATRSILRRTNHDLNEGGMLWFRDLSVADPHTVLPFVAAFLSYCTTQYGMGKLLMKPPKMNLVPVTHNFALMLRYLMYCVQTYFIITLAWSPDFPAVL